MLEGLDLLSHYSVPLKKVSSRQDFHAEISMCLYMHGPFFPSDIITLKSVMLDFVLEPTPRLSLHLSQLIALFLF